MAPPNTRARANWAVQRATALPEVWALVAKHRGVLGARRLMRVCKAARAGGLEYLRTLPGLVVCGGVGTGDVWRLDLATMRWEPMPPLGTARYDHACCAMRGALVVLGGHAGGIRHTSSVEILSSEDGGAFVDLPLLSCGGISGAAATAVEESESAAGQVLLLGGADVNGARLSTVQLVDLATGECTQQPALLHGRNDLAVGRFPDGRVVCAGDHGVGSSAEVWGAPENGAPDAAWMWRELPAMIDERGGCPGCVMSDGRFAVFGGFTSSCEALTIDAGGEHWEPLSPMHDVRRFFACGAVARCVIVAGGTGLKSAEVYDQELNRWLRLPFDLPCVIVETGSAVL
jgi:hypothetical protein